MGPFKSKLIDWIKFSNLKSCKKLTKSSPLHHHKKLTKNSINNPISVPINNKRFAYLLKDTLCEMLARQLYNWTNYQLYPSTMQSTFHARPAQTWLVAVFDIVRILYRVVKLELQCTPNANPFYGYLRRDLRVRNWHKPATEGIYT